MKKVNVSTLKNELSQFLRYVKKGETIIVVDHNLPIAALSPYSPALLQEEDQLVQLESEGIIRRGKSKLKETLIPFGKKGVGVLETLLEERKLTR